MGKLQIEYLSIDKITPYGKNPRINDDAVQYVAESIKEFGFINPILLDANGVIIAGHTRLKAAKKLGIKEVPVVYVDDLNEEQAKAFRLADNKTGEFAEWDTALLEQELAEILDLDMSLFGFGEDSTLADDLIDDKYTLAVNIPQYEITGECPSFSDMLDTDKSKELIAEIEQSGVSEDEKTFLIAAAQRHNVFNYRNIAEYYAHATPEMQQLMEKSALVIIDVDNAIANGYATRMADVLDMMEDGDA